MGANQKSRVAMAVQVGAAFVDIAIGDVVDFERVIGGPRFFVTVDNNERECPNADPIEVAGKSYTPRPRTYKLGELVDPTHFDLVPAQEPATASQSAPVQRPAQASAAAPSTKKDKE